MSMSTSSGMYQFLHSVGEQRSRPVLSEEKNFRDFLFLRSLVKGKRIQITRVCSTYIATSCGYRLWPARFFVAVVKSSLFPCVEPASSDSIR